MWNNDTALYQSIVKHIIGESDMYDIAKVARDTAYYRAIKFRYGSLDWQATIRTGSYYKQSML